MARRKIKEYWVKNLTNSDLIISDLGLKIPFGKTVNLYKLNPKLTSNQILDSEEEGALEKCFSLRKTLKLPCAPVITDQDLPTEIKEAVKSIPSRAKSIGIIDIKELDFIEELSENFTDDEAKMYEGFEEGIFDPMIDTVPMNSDGTEVGTVVNPAEDTIKESPRISDGVSTAPQQVGNGDSRYFTVRTL